MSLSRTSCGATSVEHGLLWLVLLVNIVIMGGFLPRLRCITTADYDVKTSPS